MKENLYLIIGKKIKEVRLGKSKKLVEVANLAGVSKGLLSKIENGRTIPSLPVMFQIINALEVNLSDFFDSMDTSSLSNKYILVKADEYKPIHKEDAQGYHYFSIFNYTFEDTTMQAAYLELEPNAKRDLVTTDGFELIYLIEGNIKYVLDKDTIKMEQGDTLFFDGRIPHVKQNPFGKKAKILVIYFLISKN